ncbi:MAG: chorismate synthase [Pseudomonadota bacterium]
MGNTIGRAFRVTTWGESHGPAIGVIVDGCPPRLPLCRDDVQRELDRRRPGQSTIVSARTEQDRVEILSGLDSGMTLGTPIAMLVANGDARPSDYDAMRTAFRPSHADYVYQAKYGIRASSGGGRASARETVGRVAAGAVARKALSTLLGVEIVAWVKRIETVEATIDSASVGSAEVEASIVRCPDRTVSARMIELIGEVQAGGDSLGGVVEAVARGVPPGLGEPVFDKLEADLAKAMLSIPASKGFEIGSGFAGTTMRGSQHNDVFYRDGQRIRTRTNRSGGVQGGISNGEDIVVRVAFKPTATIGREQETVDIHGNPTVLEASAGRHDPCVVPRAVPVVEAMMAIVICDHALRQQGQCAGSRSAGSGLALPSHKW